MDTKRLQWERRWQQGKGQDFGWWVSAPPEELRGLLQRGDMPSGLALDVGCGDGTITRYLTTQFERAVGFDIAVAAVQSAMALGSEEDGRCLYLVGKSPTLPFRERSFAFVFDRGCMHHLPPRAWHAYFGNVARVLRPGGFLEILYTREYRPVLTRRGMRERLSRLRGTRGPRSLSHRQVVRLLPAGLELIALEHPRTSDPSGQRILRWSHLVCRRTNADTSA